MGPDYDIEKQRREFRKALSQVTWCIKQRYARYRFILTDREVVAIRRLDVNGDLELPDGYARKEAKISPFWYHMDQSKSGHD